jgi:hypothetical protein
MSAAERIPFEELALDAAEVGAILGYAARTVLEDVACKPGFPARLTMRPATWRAGDIIDWRDANRAGRRGRRR